MGHARWGHRGERPVAGSVARKWGREEVGTRGRAPHGDRASVKPYEGELAHMYLLAWGQRASRVLQGVCSCPRCPAMCGTRPWHPMALRAPSRGRPPDHHLRVMPSMQKAVKYARNHQCDESMTSRKGRPTHVQHASILHSTPPTKNIVLFPSLFSLSPPSLPKIRSGGPLGARSTWGREGAERDKGQGGTPVLDFA